MVKIEYIFYVIGIIFLFATVAYFAYEFIFHLSQGIKAALLFLLAVVFFFAGDALRDKGI